MQQNGNDSITYMYIHCTLITKCKEKEKLFLLIEKLCLDFGSYHPQCLCGLHRIAGTYKRASRAERNYLYIWIDIERWLKF